MRNEDLMNKRVLPALQEMYKNSENIFQDKNSCPTIGFNEINETVKKVKENHPDFDAHFVLDCFYMDKDEQQKYLKKATANLRYYWRWPYKSQIIFSSSQIKEMKKRLAELEKNGEEESFEYLNLKEEINNNSENKRRDNLWKEYHEKLLNLGQKLENKEITKKEYNKKEAELAKEYGCSRRSRDAEAVYFEIWNYAPTCSKDNYNQYKTWWEDLSCIKTIKTKDNIEGLVEELFYKKRNMNTENMTETEFRQLSNVKEYMKNALLFIEKFYDMYGEYSK